MAAMPDGDVVRREVQQPASRPLPFTNRVGPSLGSLSNEHASPVPHAAGLSRLNCGGCGRSREFGRPRLVLEPYIRYGARSMVGDAHRAPHTRPPAPRGVERWPDSSAPTRGTGETFCRIDRRGDGQRRLVDPRAATSAPCAPRCWSRPSRKSTPTAVGLSDRRRPSCSAPSTHRLFSLPAGGLSRGSCSGAHWRPP
jgi:hypothetical protein